MAKKDYLPDEIDELDTWYETWLGNITAALTSLGLGATHADDTKEIVNDARTKFQAWKDKKAEAASFSDAYKAASVAAESAIRPYNKNLKTTPTYTTTIGETLGIEGPEETIDPASAKPKLKGSYVGGEVVIKFTKDKAARSIRITSKRAAETSFSYLADDTNSPYNDTRANTDTSKPEKRDYIGQFVDKDGHLIGNPSDTITVTVPGI